ncbi:MAG: hypothetical protein AAGF11_31120 [Myxococcota bacterium]
MNGACSFPDASCPSGRRYGHYSGASADECTTLGVPAGGDNETPVTPATDDDGLETERTTTGDEDATVGTTGDEGVTTATATSTPLGEESSGSVDTGLVDDSTTGADGPTTGIDPDSCEALYGLAEDFLLCEQTPDTCEFYAQTNGNCGELCQGLGGECITAFHDHSGTCQRANQIDCSSPQSNQICICVR